MITIATVFYHHMDGVNPPPWSRCYRPDWVDKLYRGVARNYSEPFRFVCLTDRMYAFWEDIELQKLKHTRWNTICLQLHAIDADRLVLMGLDTIITGNLDELFSYNGALAVPRDPYHRDQPCNGVVLCPTREDIANCTAGSDMAAIEQFPHEYLDDLYPGQVASYKVDVKNQGLRNARIVYFHGAPKPHEVDEPWIKEHWI